MLKFRTYLFELILWILLPTVAGWIVYGIFPEYGFKSYPVIPSGMIILGIMFYFMLKRIPNIPDSRRIMLFYLNIVVKMLLSLALILFVILNDRTNSLFFIITFFVFYVFLMIFEIRCFIKVTKLVSNK